MNKIRVMLVDDHTVMRAGLIMLINAQTDMEVVADASTPAEALSRFTAAAPDVVVLDLTLPGGPSLPIIEKLLSCEPKPRVLMLTMHDDPAYVRSALSLGATGYVVKTISEQDLLQSIRAVYRGRVVIDLDDEQLTATVFQQLASSSASSGTPRPLKLSARESEVMKLLGQGFTNQATAEKLDLSPKTVATYRARIGEKLGLKSTADFVKYATDTGLLDE